MRRTTIIILSLLLCSTLAQPHTYVAESALRSGTIIKLQINASGLYGISYEQIQAMGLNPERVRVLGYGGNLLPQDFRRTRTDDVPSVPFYMQVGADGVFSAGDYIIFYALGPTGWEINGSTYVHTRNCYADYGCYFLSDSAGEQKLIAPKDTIQASNAYHVYSYTALQLHEVDQYNLLDVANGTSGGGREWFGEKLTPQSNQLTIPFEFEDVDTTQNMLCVANVGANSSVRTSIKAKVAGKTQTTTIAAISVTETFKKATAKSFSVTATAKSNSLPVTLTYTSSLNTSVAYLDYIEMQVPCRMRMRGNCLYIRNTEHVGQSKPSKYHLTGADQYTQIWNMTDPLNAYVVPTTWEGDTLCWMGSNASAQFFVAVKTRATNWSAPASRGRIANQNIHQAIRGKQHIIITPDEFRYAAERLKAVHEEANPAEQWYVVSEEEVFNEFSSGTPDASAFRWMMKYLYDSFKNTDSAPRSLLLFGDGSFDNRRLLRTSPQPYLLTYQAYNSLVETEAYATDDYFGWLEDNSGIFNNKWDDKFARMQIGVGRLPIRTAEEADAMVQKLTNYIQNKSVGNWKSQLCFLADDGDHSTHTLCADAAAVMVKNAAPEYIINKIYLDSYVQETSASGDSYPIAYNTFCNLLQTGVLLMDYAGHGSANNICSEMFLTKKQVEAMVNTNQGIWALATCSFAHFDQTAQSTAELAVLNPNGGALAVVSADRTVFASENEYINKFFCRNLLTHTDPFTYPYTIGEALRLAKNENGDNMNKLPYVLLGDPSIKLAYPCQYQAIVSEMPDTLRALDLVTMRGYISNGDTTLVRRDTAHYNGKLSVTIYDKEQTVYTRDNDAPEGEKLIYSFQDYPNKIFAGDADVKDGLFSIQFRMPKDIRYNIGLGRLTMYASGEDAMGQAEAIGYSHQFKVGGSSPWIIDDNRGPDMRLYLNTPLFNDGDRVNTTPHFYANLHDENGINTVGSGIGHDLQMVLDNSPKMTYVLNSYYKADNNSYQNGSVSFVLPELADGSHTLSFRAWDLVNNASTQTIGFIVDSDMGPVVQSMLVYPNPVSQAGTLHMSLSNDRPDDLLSIEITFYNMAGQKLWTTYRRLNGNSVDLDMQDAALAPGSYIYQFTIQNATQVSEKYNGRLIVY